jgi:hypothetical protein
MRANDLPIAHEVNSHNLKMGEGKKIRFATRLSDARFERCRHVLTVSWKVWRRVKG